MKLTEVNKNKDLNVFLDSDNEGFVLGCEAKTIPHLYSDVDYKKEMKQSYVHEYERVIDRTNVSNLKNMKPAFARVTDDGTLIIK